MLSKAVFRIFGSGLQKRSGVVYRRQFFTSTKTNPKEEIPASAAQAPKQTAEIKTEARTADCEVKPSLQEKIRLASPVAGKVVDFAVYCWEETFPSTVSKKRLKEKYAKAKEEAKARRELEAKFQNLSEEELQKIQETIPDWKRGAVQTTGEKSVKERKRISDLIKEKFNESELAKQLYSTEEFKQFEASRKEWGEAKEDMKDRINNSENKAVLASRVVYDKVARNSSTAEAITAMRKFIPDFDIFNMEEEVTAIFEMVYNTYLKGDTEMLAKICSGDALGFFKAMLRMRTEKKWEPKHKYLWNIERAELIGGSINEQQLPEFTYKVDTQEVHCFVDSTNHSKVVEGDEGRITMNTYAVKFQIHQSPEFEIVGHPWEITEVRQIGHLVALI